MNHDLVDLFREKLNRLGVSDYHGLSSPGLTCYLNSVLQVLFMTVDFREAIPRCDVTNFLTIDPHLVRLFADLEKDVARTHHITETLGITDIYKQRDAAEYFEKILSLCSPEASMIFKGELIQKTTCLMCNEGNSTRSCFWVLPLTVENSRHGTYRVEEGLSGFFKKIPMCGDNKMHCSHCDQQQEAELECQMSRPPEVLTLMLKRFCFSNSRRCYVKLCCRVDVPKLLLVQEHMYKLYAVVDHDGDLSGGHYTAQVQSFENHKWYRFDDNVVEMLTTTPFQVKENCLRSRTAYLLMYRKLSRCQMSNRERCDDAGREDTPVPPHPPQDDVHVVGKKTTETHRGPTQGAQLGSSGVTIKSEVSAEEKSIKPRGGACISKPGVGEARRPDDGRPRSRREVAGGGSAVGPRKSATKTVSKTKRGEPWR